MAVGNPLGLSGTVTTGIVSALNRPVSTGTSSESPLGQQQPSGDDGRDQRHPDLGRDQPRQLRRRARQRQGRAHRHQQLDRLAGRRAEGSQSGNIGIGFAIPVKEAKSIADQLIKTGKAEHAFLGVSTKRHGGHRRQRQARRRPGRLGQRRHARRQRRHQERRRHHRRRRPARSTPRPPSSPRSAR